MISDAFKTTIDACEKCFTPTGIVWSVFCDLTLEH
jgi:hypothetical protein